MNFTEARFLLKDKYRLDENKIAQIINDLKMLENDYPLAYLIGYVEFLNTKIDLTYKTLIPRPETEYWVEMAIKDIKAMPSGPLLNILDIFSGSGCIGISVLKNVPHTHVTFADISENSIKQIEKNLKINSISQNFNLIQSDMFHKISNQKFDYIFANPPYVDKTKPYQDSLKYEPEIALFAQNNGLEIVQKFLSLAHQYIKPNATIYMEFAESQKEQIENLSELKKYRSAEFFKDQNNAWRYLKLIAV